MKELRARLKHEFHLLLFLRRSLATGQRLFGQRLCRPLASYPPGRGSEKAPAMAVPARLPTLTAALPRLHLLRQRKSPQGLSQCRSQPRLVGQ